MPPRRDEQGRRAARRRISSTARTAAGRRVRRRRRGTRAPPASGAATRSKTARSASAGPELARARQRARRAAAACAARVRSRRAGPCRAAGKTAATTLVRQERAGQAGNHAPAWNKECGEELRARRAGGEPETRCAAARSFISSWCAVRPPARALRPPECPAIEEARLHQQPRGGGLPASDRWSIACSRRCSAARGGVLRALPRAVEPVAISAVDERCDGSPR